MPTYKLTLKNLSHILLHQLVITTRIYVLHKITIVLKFMFYINSDLLIPQRNCRPQTSHIYKVRSTGNEQRVERNDQFNPN